MRARKTDECAQAQIPIGKEESRFGDRAPNPQGKHLQKRSSAQAQRREVLHVPARARRTVQPRHMPVCNKKVGEATASLKKSGFLLIEKSARTLDHRVSVSSGLPEKVVAQVVETNACPLDRLKELGNHRPGSITSGEKGTQLLEK